MRTKKGFTLIELIIVIAIMGILVGVLIPSWGYFVQRSRTRTQNNKAKTIFNAAQSVVTDLNFSERKYLAVYNDSSSTSEEKDLALKHLYSTIPGVDAENEWYYYWNGVTGYRCDADGNKLDADNAGYTSAQFALLAIDEWDEKIGKSIRKIVDDDMVYKFYVKDYIVQSVVSARYANDSFLGSYPTTLDKIDELGKIKASDIRKDKAQGAKMQYFDLDTSDVT